MAFVEILNLTKSYQIPKKGLSRLGSQAKAGKIVALDNVNLKINRGEFLSLVGPSGAGKSTLIRLFIREELATTGKIIIAGRDISKLKQQELPYFRRKVGVIFQDYKLLPQKTVQENIAFALEVCEVPAKEVHDKVLKILNMVGLAERAENYPHELSGGEQQRVAIARSLVHSPQIVIADEPTGNLDHVNAREIIDLLLRINKAGASVILATHNQDVVDKLRRRVVLIREGKIVSDSRIGKYKL